MVFNWDQKVNINLSASLLGLISLMPIDWEILDKNT